MESDSREWENEVLHWGIDEDAVLALHQYAWGAQRMLIGQSVGGAIDHFTYDNFRMHFYGALSIIADYYAPSEPANPIAHFQRVLEVVENVGVLVTNDALSDEDPRTLAALHGLWSNKYGHLYAAYDSDGYSFRRGAEVLFPRTASGVGDLSSLFEELQVSVSEVAMPKEFWENGKVFVPVFDREETGLLMQTLTSAAAAKSTPETDYCLNAQMRIEGPFSVGPVPQPARRAPASDILLPFNPQSPDEGSLTRLRYLKEEVFTESQLNQAEQETVANPFDFVPPNRARPPGIDSNLEIREVFLDFRMQFLGSLTRFFVGGCLKLHVNALHYASLANRRAVPPNGITARNVLARGSVAAKARLPKWTLEPDWYNAVESVEGYRVADAVFTQMMTEMQARVYPFAFANLVEELADPAFAHNSPITREEVECIVWLGLDSCFARAYFLLETQDYEEVLPGMAWLADSSSAHRWSLYVARQMAIMAVRIGEVPFKKSWGLWRRWKAANGLETEAGAGLPSRQAALRKTKVWYKLLVRELETCSAPYALKEEKRAQSLLRDLELLVLNRYTLWLWGSVRYIRTEPAYKAVDLWSDAQDVVGEARRAAEVVNNILAAEMSVDMFQRPYSALHQLTQLGAALDFLHNFFVSNDDLLADMFVWGARVQSINSTSAQMENALGRLSARTEKLYVDSVLRCTRYFSVLKRWARPGVTRTGELHYVFSMRNMMQETKAFDIMARRAAEYVSPVIIRTGKRCIGNRPVFFLFTNQPWFRKYHNVRVQWRITHDGRTEDLVLYNWRKVDVFDRIYVPIRDAVEWLRGRPRSVHDGCGKCVAATLKLDCSISAKAVTSFKAGEDECITKIPVSMKSSVQVQVEY